MKEWITRSRFGLISTLLTLSSAFLCCATISAAAEPIWGGFNVYGPPCWPEAQGGEEGDGGGTDSNGKTSELSEPIWIPHGEFLERHTDIFLPGRGLDIEFTRSYRSRSALHAVPNFGGYPRDQAPLGLAWSHNYDQSIDYISSQAWMWTGDERLTTFTKDSSWTGAGTRYTTPDFNGVFHVISDSHPSTYTTDNNTVYTFKPMDLSDHLKGRLESITDRNGNTITLAYHANKGFFRRQLVSISDGLGNELTLKYYDDPNSPRPGTSFDAIEYSDLIWTVTDHTGRTVEYLYDFGELNSPDGNGDIWVRHLIEVVLPAHENVAGVFDLPPEHSRFANGRSIQYEYFPDPSHFNGLLTKITDENGVSIIENHYLEPDGYDQGTYVRRIYKQDYAGESYTYMITDEDGVAGDVSTNDDYTIWVQKRNGSIVELAYKDANGSDRNRLKSRTDYPGTVPAAARGKVVWRDSSNATGDPLNPGIVWYYADTPTSPNPTPFSGPINQKRVNEYPFTKSFEFDGCWQQSEFEKPNGDVVEMVYNTSASDPRSRGALTAFHSKPSGTVLGIDGTPNTDHPDWISGSFEYGFEFWPGVSAGSTYVPGEFATVIIDGNGVRTEMDYDANGNVITIRHDIDIPNGITTPAATESFTYTTGGNLATHTHPATVRLVNGIPSPYQRVDEFVYYSDSSGTLPKDIARNGKLHIQRIDKNGEALETEFEYDAIGNVSKIIEPDGDVKTYLYNQGRQLVREQHWDHTESVLHAQTDYFYDANGNLTIEKVANFDGTQTVVAANPTITTVYKYDDRDLLIQKSIERGEVLNESISEYGVAGAHRAEPPVGSDWVTQEWEYDENDNQTVFRDGDAVANPLTSFNVEELEYDYRDLLYRKTQGAGSTNELVTQYNYDRNKRLIERITNPDEINGVAQGEIFEYDGHDRMISITDPMGNVANFEYDNNHNQVGIEILGPSDVDTDDSGGVDTAVLLYKKSLAYDPRDLLLNEDVSVFDYLAGSQSTVELQTTTYTYNEDSSIRKIESPSGVPGVPNSVEYFYDTASRTEYVEDGAGNAVMYAYDAGSNIVRQDQYDLSTTGAAGQQFITLFSYDALDRQIDSVDGVLNSSQSRYDSRSNVVMKIDGKGNATTYDYDGLNRLVTSRVRMTADGDGPESDPVLDSVNPEILTSIVYDDSGRVISETDDNLHTTLYGYDGVNRRTSITIPDGKVYSTTYNGNGVASTVVDARGVILNQVFDLNNRLKSRQVDPLSSVIPIGALHEKFNYDGLGRILSATAYSDLPGTVGLTHTTRAYDSRGYVLSESQNADGGNGFPQAMDRVVSYEVNLANSTTRIQYPRGRDIRRSYDSINRLVSIQDHELGTPMAITSFDYLGRRLERRLNGNETETAYTYDGYDLAPVNINDKGFGRIVRISTTDSGSGAVLDDFEFTWDASQNRTSYQDVGSGMKNRRDRYFSYDSSNRLVSTDVDFPEFNTDYTSPTNNGITGYDLDGVHNRYAVNGFEDSGAHIGIYKDASTDVSDHIKNNQYTYSPREGGGEWTYLYDENGNMVLKAEHNVSDFTGDYNLDFADYSAFIAAYGNEDAAADLNNDGHWDFFDLQAFLAVFSTGTSLDNEHYSYDFRNQLVEIKIKSGSALSHTVTNTYDPFARRVLEEIDDGSDFIAKQMVYGCVTLWEVIEQIQLAEGTNSEQLLTTHVYGLGIDDEVSYRLEDLVNSEDYWSHRDDLNTLTSVSDDQGVIKERYAYGDFGKVMIFDPVTGDERVSTSVGAVHLYTGRSIISGTLLYDYRFRVLDCELGKFNQRDPLGYIDSMSVYSYVKCNPMLNRDPLGLWGWDNDWLQMGVGGLLGGYGSGVAGDGWQAYSEASYGVVGTFTGGMFDEDYGFLGYKDEVLEFVGHDDDGAYDSGKTGARVAEGAILSYAGLRYLTPLGKIKVKMMIHPPHGGPNHLHHFWHFQGNWWMVGVRGSGGVLYRIPFNPKLWTIPFI